MGVSDQAHERAVRGIRRGAGAASLSGGEPYQDPFLFARDAEPRRQLLADRAGPLARPECADLLGHSHLVHLFPALQPGPDHPLDCQALAPHTIGGGFGVGATAQVHQDCGPLKHPDLLQPAQQIPRHDRVRQGRRAEVDERTV